MLEIVRKFEEELLRLVDCEVVRIEQKEYFDKSDIFEEDFTVRKGFYIVPKCGGKVNKIVFGYNNYDGELKPFSSVDSIEDLKKYNVTIPKELMLNF